MSRSPVLNRLSSGVRRLERAYFKCFKRDCLAKLTVDLDLETRELVKASSSGERLDCDESERLQAATITFSRLLRMI